MTLRTILKGAVCAAAVLVAAPAFADTINFDNLGNGVVVDTQYAGVTFSSDPGFEMLTTAQSLGSSLPNFICSGTSAGIDCVDNVYVDFAGAGVNGLNFLAIGSNNLGVVANINVYTNGVLASTVDLIGNALGTTPIPVDLSSFHNVTRIEIVNDIDDAGLGYDDFNFSPASTSSGAPEPASWAMMLVGFGGLGALMRRRRPQLA